jgi:hypothetical protein
LADQSWQTQPDRPSLGFGHPDLESIFLRQQPAKQDPANSLDPVFRHATIINPASTMNRFPKQRTVFLNNEPVP